MDLPAPFGKYLLTESLAMGGMAEIYLAKLTGPGGFEKQLVIKQIHASLSGNRHFVDLFVAEAKTLVTLAHGNIVPVYELGVVGDTYFIAMEYIDGPTLYRLTERASQREERIAPAVAAWIAAKILEGLDYAHRKGDGVIHRDLSPRNVMLSRDGEVKLVDFGIALTFGEDSGESATAPPTGSFPYMSPEQVRREALSPKTDLFSAGVLLWEMLVGQRLFARPDADATLAAVTGAEIAAPAKTIPGVPDALDTIVMRALERDEGARWATAADMLAALQKYLYSIADAPPGPREVAALVARFCPPETRRLPTNLPVEHDSEPPPQPGGPRTAVIPRAPAKSFATHHALDELLTDTGPTTKVAPRTNPSAKPATNPPTEPPVEEARTDRPPDGYRSSLQIGKLGVPGREAPSRSFVLILGIGAIAIALFAIYIFIKGRGAVLATDLDAGVRVDATALATPHDAPSVDAAPFDSAPEIVDAGPDAAPVRDASPILTARPDAARDAAIATGMLKIGADPWGEIVVDGTPRGRTPSTIVVTVGHHVVDVIFSGDDPPQKKSFPVDVAANETVPIQASFPRSP